jgi:flagellar hook-associated protein 3 FlgL
MRVSTHQYHLNMLRNIEQSTAQYNQHSVSLASGKRIQRPSDDPLGTVMLMTLNSELTALEQYQSNMDAVHYKLGQQETQLSGIVNILYSIQELITKSADGSMGDVEHQALGHEMSVLFPAIVDLLNAKDANGQYYFSGSLTDTIPFQLDGLGNFQYLGDNLVRDVKVSENARVTSNILGSDLAPNADFLNQMKDYLALFSPVPDPSIGDESRNMIGNLNNFLASVTGEITRIGAIRSGLDEVALGSEEIAMFTGNLRDDISATDYAATYMKMNQALASYESSLQVYASVTRLSLFSYY